MPTFFLCTLSENWGFFSRSKLPGWAQTFDVTGCITRMRRWKFGVKMGEDTSSLTLPQAHHPPPPKQKKYLGHLRAVKQLMQYPYTLRWRRVDPVAFQYIYLDISRIFYLS